MPNRGDHTTGSTDTLALELMLGRSHGEVAWSTPDLLINNGPSYNHASTPGCRGRHSPWSPKSGCRFWRFCVS